MTGGDEDPQQQQFRGGGFPGGFGFPGGGFGGGINIEDLMRGGFFGGGHPGGHPGGHHGQGQQRKGARTTYSFSFGGG